MNNIELTEEQKQDIVEAANVDTTPIEEGNTQVVRVSDDEELNNKIDAMTPKELFDANIAASYRSIYKLESILPSLSKKNLMRLLLATLKLPQEGLNVNFGGTAKDKHDAIQAFIQCQVARNAYTYVVSIQAATQARMEREAKKKESCGGDCKCAGDCNKESCKC